MVRDIKCNTIVSVEVHLTFDDGNTKDRIISTNDVIEVEYYQNGCRRNITGKVRKISCDASDPKGWYVIIDGSSDFDCIQVKICPMNILDLEILVKNDRVTSIQTPDDNTGIPFMRIVKGRLQYSMTGAEGTWRNIVINRDNIIKDESGTVPLKPGEVDTSDIASEDEEIKDEN
jgi:hypothetical protein